MFDLVTRDDNFGDAGRIRAHVTVGASIAVESRTQDMHTVIFESGHTNRKVSESHKNQD